MNEKSPGGSTFPYYYKGGELHCLKYGNFSANEEGLIAVMEAEEDFITKHNQRLNIWVDFYETKLTDAVVREFFNSVTRLNAHIRKLAIVGCSHRDRKRLNRVGRSTGNKIPIPVRYFSDPEDAKTWLVSESL